MKKQNKWKYLVLSACVLAGSVSPAFALEEKDFDFHTTEHLYNLCSVSSGHDDYATAKYACRGFIKGAIQYHDGVSHPEHFKRLICYPAGTTVVEGEAAFVAWAKTNKNDRALMQQLPVKGLVRALSEKYPCSK